MSVKPKGATKRRPVSRVGHGRGVSKRHASKVSIPRKQPSTIKHDIPKHQPKAILSLSDHERLRRAHETYKRVNHGVFEPRSGSTVAPGNGIRFIAKSFHVSRDQLRLALSTGICNPVLGRPALFNSTIEMLMLSRVQKNADGCIVFDDDTAKDTLNTIFREQGTLKPEGSVSAGFVRTVLDHLRAEKKILKANALTMENKRIDACTKSNIQPYFDGLQKFLDANPGVLVDRRRMANMDETSNAARVAAAEQVTTYLPADIAILKKKCGDAPRTREIGASSDGHVTLAPFVVASGEVVTTAIIVTSPSEDASFKLEWIAEPHPDVLPLADVLNAPFVMTKNGYQTSAGFGEVCKKHFFPLWRKLPGLEDKDNLPLLFLIDGCRQHDMSGEFLAACEEFNITVVYFPHNTTTKLQPLDLEANKVYKKHMRTLNKAIATVAASKHQYLDGNMMKLRSRSPTEAAEVDQMRLAAARGGQQKLAEFDAKDLSTRLQGLDPMLSIRTRFLASMAIMRNYIEGAVVRAGFEKGGLAPFKPENVMRLLSGVDAKDDTRASGRLAHQEARAAVQAINDDTELGPMEWAHKIREVTAPFDVGTSFALGSSAKALTPKQRKSAAPTTEVSRVTLPAEVGTTTSGVWAKKRQAAEIEANRIRAEAEEKATAEKAVSEFVPRTGGA